MKANEIPARASDPVLSVPVLSMRLCSSERSGAGGGEADGVLVTVHAAALPIAAAGEQPAMLVPGLIVFPQPGAPFDAGALGRAFDQWTEGSSDLAEHRRELAACRSGPWDVMIHRLSVGSSAPPAGRHRAFQPREAAHVEPREFWLRVPWLLAAGAIHGADVDPRLPLRDQPPEVVACLATLLAAESGGVWPPIAGGRPVIRADASTRLLWLLRQCRPGRRHEQVVAFCRWIFGLPPVAGPRGCEHEQQEVSRFSRALRGGPVEPALLCGASRWRTLVDAVQDERAVLMLLAHWLRDEAALRLMIAVCGPGLKLAVPALCDGSVRDFASSREEGCYVIDVDPACAASFPPPAGVLVPPQRLSLRWMSEAAAGQLGQWVARVGAGASISRLIPPRKRETGNTWMGLDASAAVGSLAVLSDDDDTYFVGQKAVRKLLHPERDDDPP